MRSPTSDSAAQPLRLAEEDDLISKEDCDELVTEEAQAREGAEQAADRLRVLQRLTSHLAATVTLDEVLQIVLRDTVTSIGAQGAAVALPNSDRRLQIIALTGFDPETEDRYRFIDPSAELPIARAFRTGNAEWVTGIEDLHARFPSLRSEKPKTSHGSAWAALPLVARGAVLGAVALSFPRPRRFAQEERSFLEAVVQQCALAVDRALIFAREHEARSRAELQAVELQRSIEQHRALEAGLEAGERRFRAILQSPMMGVMLTDFSGRILEANEALLKMIGYTREDLLAGRINWAEITAPDFAEATQRAVEELRRTGYISSFEKAYIRKDGSRVPVLVASTHIADQGLNTTFVLDISERKQMLEESQAGEARSRFLAEASRILSSSLDYRVTLDAISRLAVPALADWCAVDMLGADGKLERLAIAHPDPEKVALAAEMARRYPTDLSRTSGLAQVIRTGLPEAHFDIPETLLPAVARDEEHLRLIRTLGLRSYMCVPLKRRGVIVGALSMVYAESGRLYSAPDLALAMELAHQAGVAVDNALLYQEARDAIRLRDEFLSVASHELKTPLTPLQLRMQVLERDLKRTQYDRVEGHVDIAQRQVRKLSSLIDGLLDVSRISAGRMKLELEPVDLSALIGEVSARYEQEAMRAGSLLSLRVDPDVVGTWDRIRLEQVVTNMLSNAIKYGSGKPVHLTVQRSEGGAVIEVRDHGIGIAPEDSARIFERFERAVSDKNYGGLGLGLYITRRIVEALGGTIAVDSVPGQGSTFTVRLPANAPSVDEPAAAASAASSSV